jgi:putative endonuclease
MFTVYILYSELLDKYYVGYTNNLDRRISEHNRKKGKYTDQGIPWLIVYTESYPNRQSAKARESFIKSKKSKVYIIELLNKR